MHQLFDLLAGELTTTGELAEHPLAIRPRFVDHLPTLLLGHRQLGFGIGGGVGSTSRRLDLGLLAHPHRLVARLAQETRRVEFRFLADLGGRLASGRQHPRRLLTEEARQRGVVEADVVEVRIRLRRAQLALEEALTLLQPTKFGGDHPEEVAHLRLIESATAGAERGVGDRRRRRRIGTDKRHGHAATLRAPVCPMVAISRAIGLGQARRGRVTSRL